MISVVIPVHNEEALLRAAVEELRDRLAALGHSYEIVLAENGSKDGTSALLAQLSAEYEEVRYYSLAEPNYGKALKHGIEGARGRYVICEEIDLCDSVFHRQALALLEAGQADLVVGSKLMGGARDERPFLRHAASLSYTLLLRALVGFRGTDTHGLKAFRREALLPQVAACVVDKDVFASELVIRAYRSGARVREIPVQVIEKRPPSIDLARRVPNVLINIARLTYAVRVRR